ncbi:hypothetical protein A0O34_13975 [Chryseobacterium glaciei]|uniref:O-antigen ligase-related domain-containing protein n=1 Tax=Chryseobacterium glaciei TaxID=1685010 RepID=A0A172XX00_9FLAO|nr:O-antigen ligase family protein [Chryseobacterium glaciei]ANF51543.1 hypothetical protein A0O34_13975 [Chryseobacterium glaciei]
MEAERSNKLQVFFLTLMLYGYELISFFPDLLKIESRPLSIVLRLVVVVTGILVIFKNQMRLTKVHVLLFFFWALYLLRLFYDAAITSKNIMSPIDDYWSFSLLIMISIFACATNFSKKTLLDVKNYVLIILFIVNIWGLYNNVTAPQIVPDDILVRADGNSALNTVSFGKTSSVLFFLCFISLLKNKKNLITGIYILGMILSLYNVFMAGSRGPLVQLLAALLLYLAVNLKQVKLKYVFLFFIAGIILLNLFPSYFDVSKLIFQRISETGFSSNENDQYRGSLLKSAWEQFLDNPFFGDSIETNFGNTYPHNIILESFMAMGIIGGILSIIIFMLNAIYSMKLMQVFAYSLFGAILIMDTVGSMSAGSIVNYLLIWPMLSLSINLAQNEK